MSGSASDPPLKPHVSVTPASQIAMGTFIVSFIGNGFVVSAQGSPLFSKLSPKARRRLLVLLYFTVGIATVATLPTGIVIVPGITF